MTDRVNLRGERTTRQERSAEADHCRRTTDRRSGRERRFSLAGHGTERLYSWEDQRAQYWTRLLFCGLALIYFNFCGDAQVRPWTNLTVVTLAFSAFGVSILMFMWHATRVPHAPWRQRLTMWIDIAMASFAVLADATISSPGYLVYLMVILGNGMRYGLRLFGEAVFGCLGAAVVIVSFRLFDYVHLFSVSARVANSSSCSPTSMASSPSMTPTAITSATASWRLSPPGSPKQ
ncbi:MAG: hypothetical protein HZC22_05935 [Rhodocyclales bacterium]|nr:hypothetical protein [Rhodocyclales bacterium]